MPHTAAARLALVPDADRGATTPALVAYPGAAPEHARQLGPYEITAAWDAPPADGAFPLVVVSHGSGGSHLTHRGLALHLARAGFVVLVPEHPRNNRSDNSLADTPELLVERPRFVRRLIDWAYADDALAPRLVADRVAVVGHSLGAYTGLALAGGRPAAVTRDGPVHPPVAIPVERDPRLRALVLLAPATPWYLAPGALADVHVPILMLTGARDAQTPAWMGELVSRGVPSTTRVTHRVVADAGHYSFLAPFPPAMASPGFAPSQDAPGFDRAAFHAQMYPEIAAFLHAALGEG